MTARVYAYKVGLGPGKIPQRWRPHQRRWRAPVALTFATVPVWGQTFHASTQKYKEKNPSAATGRSGGASLTARLLLAKDDSTLAEVTTGELDSAATPPGSLAKVQLKGFDSLGETMFTIDAGPLTGGGYWSSTYHRLWSEPAIPDSGKCPRHRREAHGRRHRHGQRAEAARSRGVPAAGGRPHTNQRRRSPPRGLDSSRKYTDYESFYYSAQKWRSPVNDVVSLTLSGTDGMTSHSFTANNLTGCYAWGWDASSGRSVYWEVWSCGGLYVWANSYAGLRFPQRCAG